MQWLEKHLDEKGYPNANYSIVARELIETRSIYDIGYDVEVRTASSTVAMVPSSAVASGAVVAK